MSTSFVRAHRFSVIVASFIVYGVIFLLLYPSIQGAVGIFCLLPAIAGAWLLGMRGGILVAFLSYPLNAFFYAILGESAWTESTKPGAIIGVVGVMGCAFAIGRFRDLREALKLEVEERKRVELALEEARDHALQASRAKADFLANMSHELRTPLNAVIGYSELMREELEEREEDDLCEDAGRILVASRQLMTLINDILDLSKIEAGEMTVFWEEADLGRLLDEVVVTMTPLFENNQNTFRLEATPLEHPVWLDTMKVRQLLTNLLSNATKFTQEGTITLRVEPGHQEGRSWLVFEVEDSGVGIESAKLAELFEPFRQADKSVAKHYGGTGLGLPISQRFCELLGGTLAASSVVGEGTTFRASIPLHTTRPKD